MTICELIVVPLIIDIVSGIISTYIINFLDKKHKNDRHSPKHGH